MKKVWLYGPAAALGMLMLILDPKTAMQGAQGAVTLCLQTVVPTLFPFLFISGILTSVLTSVSLPFLRPLGRMLRIPEGTEPIFLTGLIGGYPVGAQLVSGVCDHDRIDAVDARRMLGFCSNCGPSFLFGIIGAKFIQPWVPWALWAIHILCAVLTALLLPGKIKTKKCAVTEKKISLVQAMSSTVKNIAIICGWVMLFRILLTFLDRWFLWVLPGEMRIIIYGLLELTNGCCALESIYDPGFRFIAACGLLGFGGICVMLQTASVTGDLGLGMYVRGKLLHCVLSLLFSYVFSVLVFHTSFSFLSILIPVILAALAICLLKSEISTGKRVGSVV